MNNEINLIIFLLFFDVVEKQKKNCAIILFFQVNRKKIYNILRCVPNSILICLWGVHLSLTFT